MQGTLISSLLIHLTGQKSFEILTADQVVKFSETHWWTPKLYCVSSPHSLKNDAVETVDLILIVGIDSADAITHLYDIAIINVFRAASLVIQGGEKEWISENIHN